MYGHYRNTGIPRLQNYQHALDRFNSTKPIRGRTDITKPQVPLGHRNKVDSFWMRHCQLTQDVECYLYRTPVVTFKANGEVLIKSDGWESISTANFIGEVLAMGAYIYDRSLCIGLYNEDGMLHYRVPSEGTLTLKKEGRWQYVSGAPNNVIHKVNRKAINQIRKQYKDFKDYARSMIKLRAGVFSTDEMEEVFGKANFPNNFRYSWNYGEAVKTIANTRAWISDTSENKHNQFYKALLSFVRSYGSFASTSPEAFEAGFNEFTIGVHRDEVLIEEVLPMGVIKKDNYGRFYRKAWSKYHIEKPEAFALGVSHEQAV